MVNLLVNPMVNLTQYLHRRSQMMREQQNQQNQQNRRSQMSREQWNQRNGRTVWREPDPEGRLYPPKTPYTKTLLVTSNA